MRKIKLKSSVAALAALVLGFAQARAGTATFNFDTDPSANGQLQLFGTSTWSPSGGNPGGYLSITDAQNSQRGAVLFSDFDNGAVVKAFSFSMDVRIGGGTDSPADGFSINYVRAGDPVLTDPLNGWATGPNGEANLPEEGATTGISVGFDAWDSGGGDRIGIDVRVDNKLILQYPMTTLNGSCTDTNSIQTGPQDPNNPGAAGQLCWAPLSVNLDTNGLLSISYKNAVILTNFQTSYTPSPGRLVLVGRTGGANENHHVDNIKITTIPAEVIVVEPPQSTPNGFTFQLDNSGPSIVDPSSISVKLDSTAVTGFTTSQSGNQTLVTYRLPAGVFAAGSQHTLDITVKDTRGVPVTVSRTFTVENFATLAPASAVIADKTKTGFLVHPYETDAGNPNDLAWTEDQLLGLHGPNLADLSGASNGFYVVNSVINWDKDGNTGVDGNFNAPDYPDAVMPGLPGTGPESGFANSTEEVLTFLEFPAAGVYNMGVNSDDGFKVSAGKAPRDVFNKTLGFFNAGRGASDTTFRFYVPQAGIYPFRLLWENGGGGANVEWFTINPDGTKVLVNDSTNTVKAYYSAPIPAYVSSVSPGIGSTSVRPDSAINIQVTDGTTQPLDANSVQVLLNGAPVTVTKNKAGTVTTLTAASTAMLPSGSTNTVTLVYSGTGSPAGATTNTWNFVVQNYLNIPATLMSPLGSGTASQPGFRVKVNQIAPATGTTDNSNEAAEQQLAGLFGPNVADLTGADSSGYFNISSVINWDRGANDGSNGEDGNFKSANGYPENPIPGIPGSTGSFESVAAEIQTYVEFPKAGYYEMGVNSDDGFRVTVAEQPGRLTALEVTSPSSIAKMYGAQPSIPAVGGVGAPLPLVPQQPLLKGKLVLADPLIADADLKNAAAISGNIAMIQRGVANFHDKVIRAQKAGAIAAVIYNREDQAGLPPIVMTGDSTGIHIPAVMISFDDGVTITNHLNDAGGVVVQVGDDGSSFRLGEFDGGRGSSDTLFGFVVPQAGVYPLRCIWEQGGGGANLEWFTVNSDGSKVLLNDSKNATALKAFRARTFTQAPKLSATLQSGKVTISWTGSGTLQQAASVTGPWTDVTGASGSYTTNATGTMKFFRLK